MATRDNNSPGNKGNQGNKPGAQKSGTAGNQPVSNQPGSSQAGSSQTGSKPGTEKTPKATLDLKATEMSAKDGDSKPAETAAGTSKGSDKAAQGSAGASASSKAAGSGTSVPKVEPKAGGRDTKSGASAAGASAAGASAADAKRTPASDQPNARKPDEKAAAKDNAKPKAAPTPKRKGGGIGSFISHMAAGIIGAIGVIFGTQYLPPDLLPEQLGITSTANAPAADSTQVNDLAQAVSQLREDVSGVKQAQSTAAAQPNASAGGPISMENLPEQVRTQLTEVADLQSQVATLLSQLQDAETERAALSAKLEEAASAQPAVGQEVAGRIGQLEESFRALAAAGESGEGGPVAQVAALTGRLNDFETELDTKLSALRQSVQEDVAAASNATQERLRVLGEQAGTQLEGIETVKAASRRIGEELEGVRTRAERATSGIAELREQAGTFASKLTQVTERLDGVSEAVTATRDELTESLNSNLSAYARADDVTAGTQALQNELKAVAERIEGVAAREATRAEGTKQIVLALELSELKRAIARGRTFGSELARVEKLAPGALDVEALQPFADSGVPTATALEDSFAPAARQALDTELQEQNASWMDQLVAGAQSIVKVRRTGEIKGNDTEAVVARMEARLEEGDLIATAKEASALGESQRTALGDWLARLEARVAVDEAIAQVEDQLKGSLAGTSVGAQAEDGSSTN